MARVKNKLLALGLLIIFLSSILTTTLVLSKTKAQSLPPGFEPLPRIYIKADGSIEGTDKINRAGDVYTFTADLKGFEPIIVEKDDIVIDGAGNSIHGDDQWLHRRGDRS